MWVVLADTTALVIGSLGLLLACVSLGWQAFVFGRSGSRARLEIQRGLLMTGGDTYNVSKFERGETKRLHWEGDHEGFAEVIIVTIRNVGRLATTVTGISMEGVMDDPLVPSFSVGPPTGPPWFRSPLPHRLESESQEFWLFPIETFVNASSARATVHLGSGRTLVADCPLPGD